MGDPLICYVALNRVPPLDDVVAAIRATPNAIITPGASTETPGHFVDMPGGPVLVLLIPMSLPEHMLEDDMAQRVAWPDWQAATRRWQSHLIVSKMIRSGAADDAQHRAGDILALSASLARRLSANCVGWAGSNLFVTPDDLARQLAERIWPIEVLVRCIWRGQPRPEG